MVFWQDTRQTPGYFPFSNLWENVKRRKVEPQNVRNLFKISLGTKKKFGFCIFSQKALNFSKKNIFLRNATILD